MHWKIHPGYPVKQGAFTPSIDEPIWLKGIHAALWGICPEQTQPTWTWNYHWLYNLIRQFQFKQNVNMYHYHLVLWLMDKPFDLENVPKMPKKLSTIKTKGAFLCRHTTTWHAYLFCASSMAPSPASSWGITCQTFATGLCSRHMPHCTLDCGAKYV